MIGFNRQWASVSFSTLTHCLISERAWWMVLRTIQGIFERYLPCFTGCHWSSNHYISSPSDFLCRKKQTILYMVKPPAVFRISQGVRKCHQCKQKPHTCCQAPREPRACHLRGGISYFCSSAHWRWEELKFHIKQWLTNWLNGHALFWFELLC